MVLWLDPMRPAFLRDRHAHFDGSIRLPADLSLVDDAEFPGGAVSLGRVSYIRSQTADSTASIPGTAMSRSIRAIASTAPTRERSAPVEMSPGEPVTANSWRAVLSSLARAVSVGMESLLRCASLRRYARAALSSIGMPAYPGG